jgi:DNA (cytosine-5)-methyltransferase 1
MRFDRHYFSEVDEYAIKVYEKRFPKAIGLGDIRAIKGALLPDGDWSITGGFPCQDISVAGKGAGLAGERSGLWYEYARLIGELRPQYAIMENVGALVFRGLDSVLGSLSEIGYDAEWQDIRASDVGAPHRRERIWIVAYPKEMRRGEGHAQSGRARAGTGEAREWRGSADGGTLPDPDSRRLEIERERGILAGIGKALGSDLDGCGSQAMADADEAQCAGDGSAEPDEAQHGAARGLGASIPDANGGQAGRLAESRSECGKWLPESGFCRVANGVPARVDRLKCLGNSIVPQIAEMIFARISV